MDLKILPLEGISINGSVLAFGMTRAETEMMLGAGEAIGPRCYYENGELAIDFDADERVEFIEFLGGIDGQLQPTLDGISVFSASADEVEVLLRRKNRDGGEASEQGYAVRFHAVSVGVYREITPDDVREMIEEMQASGIPTAQNEDLAADQRRAEHWATIGLGKTGYYNA